MQCWITCNINISYRATKAISRPTPQATSIKLHAHSNVTTPWPGMNSDKLRAYCWHDLVTHRVKNVVITSEDLGKDHTGDYFNITLCMHWVSISSWHLIIYKSKTIVVTYRASSEEQEKENGASVYTDVLVIGHFRNTLCLYLCQNESFCEDIHMKMCSAYRFIFMQIKLIFIWKVLLEDSFRNKDTR